MNGKVANSLISQGCEIDGIVENSVLFGGVKVARGAYIRNSIIMQDTVVREGASVYYSIVDGDTEIGAGAVVGEAMEKGGKITLVGSDLKIPHGGVIKAGEIGQRAVPRRAQNIRRKEFEDVSSGNNFFESAR